MAVMGRFVTVIRTRNRPLESSTRLLLSSHHHTTIHRACVLATSVCPIFPNTPGLLLQHSEDHLNTSPPPGSRRRLQARATQDLLYKKRSLSRIMIPAETTMPTSTRSSPGLAALIEAIGTIPSYTLSRFKISNTQRQGSQ